MKLKLSIALTIGLFLAGCGYELPKTAEPADNSNQSPANKSGNADQKNANAEVNKTAETSSTKEESGEEGGNLVFSAGSQTATYPCNGREVEFESSATAYTITLTGECRKLIVDGVSNKVNVDKVGEIVVRGVSNKIVYGEGLGGKKPKISKSGTDTAVDTRESIEKKKDK